MILATRDLSIGYHKSAVGFDLNFTLNQQEVVCLLGANGCGKTTFLKTLLGLLTPIAGEVYLNHKALSTFSAREIAQMIGYVPQAHQLFPYSVEEVVLMGRTAHLPWYSTPNKQDIAIVHQSLESLNIAHLTQRIYTELSGGERQLVLIARALSQQTNILILDEPTSNLDFGNQIKVMEHIQNLKRQGFTILLTTHQPEQAEQIADRVLLFHQGHIIADAPPEKTLTIENLAQIYGLEEQLLRKYKDKR
ncbi:ABC transporter ATP-binding protein [Pasteurella bettyae]|uniref:ABC transporter, ATP-binding protein n=1 Tax=Pasteurella bettyae CCUG 2042 TaxID=1095749 RepID=I3DB99_9PAST|nr:ABC transporter ATP-binding protein [Pasteurella bettyae]EIJ68992.1 ABC transporter, ATP-binding protein [Pasteurella bettyae CCUG 2042]SUB22931.1 ABC transporter ATP-binding protein [Pasteurella bettyae]